MYIYNICTSHSHFIYSLLIIVFFFVTGISYIAKYFIYCLEIINTSYNTYNYF